jgi:hypothetical protein
MDCDGDTALLCDGLCYKTVHKWTVLVRDYGLTVNTTYSSADISFSPFSMVGSLLFIYFFW